MVAVMKDGRLSGLRVAVVKLTNRCNIRCAYCYENIVNKGADMSSAVFQHMASSILSSTSLSRVLFVLHGGEPTILPTSWFEENLQHLEEEGVRHGKNVEVSIQSNLIDLSDEKLDVFRTFDVHIGGSLDNPETVDGAQRPLAHKALKTFRRARELGVHVGVLSTINASNVDAMPDFCDWLRNTLGVSRFKANVAYPVGAGLNVSVPDASKIVRAKKAIIEYMLESNCELIEDNLCWELVRFFENCEAGLPRAGTLCDDRHCGAGSRVVGIAPNGDILPCGRFAWNDGDFFLGNVLDAGESQETAFFDRVGDFHSKQPENWRECANCEARAMCNFGCQAFIVRSTAKINLECNPTQLRFHYYRENKDRLQMLYERFCQLQKRQSISPVGQDLIRLWHLLTPTQRQGVQQELLACITQGKSVSPSGLSAIDGSIPRNQAAIEDVGSFWAE